MLSEKRYIGLGQVPVGVGAVLRGWDLIEQQFRGGAHVVDFRAMTEKCPRNCRHCFTNKNRRTLSLSEIKRIIDELAVMKTRGINFDGEGEPTVDPWFFEIIEYTASKGIVPIVFSEAALKLRDCSFVRRLKESGATVCPKCDSLFNRDYENWLVNDRTGRYFDERNKALQLLMETGFNKIEADGATRLGLDMIVSSRNIGEVADTLRFARRNNIWIVFCAFLPAGRSVAPNFDRELIPSVAMMQGMRDAVATIDRDEFGFNHPIWNNFATMPCVERMQIYGDGRVSPCPGNETIVGRVQDLPISELHQMILDQFPGHKSVCFNGNCLYRPEIDR